MDLTINLYSSPPYPETTFSFTIGLYGSIIPSGQGHFSEQPTGTTLRSAHQIVPQPSVLPVLVKDETFLNENYNPYSVSGTLLETPQLGTQWSGVWVYEPVSGYNDFGVLTTPTPTGIVSFLRPAYSSTLKTSAFFKASGIANPQANPLALEAAESGGRFHYLSNAYYYVTTKSDFSFSPYLILNRANYPNSNIINAVRASGLANNVRTISMTSGVITDVLTY